MRFSTTISLVIIFLFNAIGIQLLFAFLIIQREDEMRSSLIDAKEETLEVITIDLSDNPDFTRINEKEIFYNGSMYDVKYEEIKNNKIIFHCEKDEKELDLLNHFSKFHDDKKENNRKNPLSRFVQKTAQILFFQNQNASNLQLNTLEHNWSPKSIQYDQPDILLLTPPPQNSVS